MATKRRNQKNRTKKRKTRCNKCPRCGAGKELQEKHGKKCHCKQCGNVY